MAKTAAELVADAKRCTETPSVDRAAAVIEGDDELLVDLRKADERANRGSIAGSRRAPRGRLGFWADRAKPAHRAEFAPVRRVVPHGASGGRLTPPADSNRQLGPEHVARLNGGPTAWQAAGRPVDDAPPARRPAACSLLLASCSLLLAPADSTGRLDSAGHRGTPRCAFAQR